MIKIKAVALVSSGLDSLLSVKIVRDMGIDITGLHCVFRFDPTEEVEAIRMALDQLFNPFGVPVIIRDVTDDFFPLLIHPDHGYGSEVNPCIDCKIFMYKQARQLMEKMGASFLVTGEVVGQRPMSQNKSTLYHIESQAGMRDRVLRPLSANNLRKCLPEKKGWIDREQLFGITGRGRKMQMVLADNFSIHNYNQPAGGCILTTPQFGERTRALFSHRKKSDISVSDIQLMRLGRHFWPNNHLHVIVGRNREDNQNLEKYVQNRIMIEPAEIAGPLTLAENIHDQTDLHIAAAITARYCRHQNQPVVMKYKNSGNIFSRLIIRAFPEDQILQWQI